MARVIKAGAGQKPARPATRVIVDAGAKKVIEREVYQAKQDAEHILMRAEQARQEIIAEGKKQAAQAREEAMARGAAEAFAAAATEALTAFRKRAERYGEAADDIRVLALEVVKKILGGDPDLGQADVERIMQRGMAQLRARRRLRLQVSERRLGELAHERPNLMKALQNEPDLVVEAVDDVNVGFARVVTEVGGALCAEQTALDALSEAVNVKETPRERGAPTQPRNTLVGTGPTGMEELRSSNGTDSVPDAAVIEEHIDEDENSDDTLNLSPRRRPPTRRGIDDVEEIQAEEDEIVDERTASRPAVSAVRVPTGQVQARARGATRVMPIDVQPASDDDATLRQAPLIRAADENTDDSDEDEDLDLFTDDAVTSRKKR
jgi:flagellar biosynthesis/type III secretory pathway protein FliH